MSYTKTHILICDTYVLKQKPLCFKNTLTNYFKTTNVLYENLDYII